MIALSLELLDLSMAKCGNAFHAQISTKDFMNTIVSLLNSKNMPIQVRILFIICNLILFFYIDTTKGISFDIEVGYKI